MLVQAREFLTIYLLILLELPLFCPSVGWFLTGLWNEITVQMGCQWLPEVFGMENECLLHFDYRIFCEKTHCLGECGICLPLNSLWIKYRTYVEMACLSSSCHAPFCTFDASYAILCSLFKFGRLNMKNNHVWTTQCASIFSTRQMWQLIRIAMLLKNRWRGI